MSVDISIAWKTAVKILNGMLSLLPNFILGDGNFYRVPRCGRKPTSAMLV